MTWDVRVVFALMRRGVLALAEMGVLKAENGADFAPKCITGFKLEGKACTEVDESVFLAVEGGTGTVAALDENGEEQASGKGHATSTVSVTVTVTCSEL